MLCAGVGEKGVCALGVYIRNISEQTAVWLESGYGMEKEAGIDMCIEVCC